MNDFKWAALLLVGMAVAAFSGIAFEEYCRERTKQTAIENGYVQVENENGKVLWVKETEGED